MNYLSINSIKNKFESIEEIIQNTFYISIFSETKIDSACPSQQYPGVPIFRGDSNANGGGLLFYVNHDLS